MKLYTVGEVATEVGVAEHTINYWLKKWGIAATCRAGHVRLYDAKTLDEIKGRVGVARAVGAFTSVKCPVDVLKD